jgi:hypothetical protein
MRGFGNPAALAAAAGGLIAAILALWAMRGLPLGGVVLWFAPAPIFAAGLAFGPPTAWLAAAAGALVMGFSAHPIALAFYLAMFALPAALLITLYMRPAGPAVSAPVMALGLYPVLLLGLLAAFLAGEGGLEAVLRDAVEQGTRRMGIQMGEAMLDAVVRVKAAAVGFWTALLLIGNAALAQWFLRRSGLSLVPWPDLAEARMPTWYLGLLAASAAGLAVTGGVLWLSFVLLLLVPFFLMGVASVHRRTRGRGGRGWLLAAFYALMIVFLQFMAPAMVGLGLYEQWARRAVPPPQT